MGTKANSIDKDTKTMSYLFHYAKYKGIKKLNYLFHPLSHPNTPLSNLSVHIEINTCFVYESFWKPTNSFLNLNFIM